MRRLNLILTLSTVVLAVVVIWSLTTRTSAPHTEDANAAPVSASIDAMQMMKGARNLPVERFDAH
jgi:hypothetical protein